MEQKIKLKNFIEKSITKFGDIFDFSKTEYINNRTNLLIICPIHGEFIVTPSNFLNNNIKGCPKCGVDIRTKKKSLKTDDFINRSINIHNNKYNYEKVVVIKGHDKVIITCPIHGDFEQTPSSHMQGHGCFKCSSIISVDSTRLNTLIFIKRAKLIHNNFYNYDKVNYISCNKKVEIICPIHGSFFQKPTIHINNKCGCPKCTLKNQNKLFDRLSKDLNYKLCWEYSPDWLNKQRLDIAIPDLKVGIEYNGRQHYVPIDRFGGELGLKDIQKRDILKKEKCKNNNWNLYELSFDYTENDYLILIENINKLCVNN